MTWSTIRLYLQNAVYRFAVRTFKGLRIEFKLTSLALDTDVEIWLMVQFNPSMKTATVETLAYIFLRCSFYSNHKMSSNAFALPTCTSQKAMRNLLLHISLWLLLGSLPVRRTSHLPRYLNVYDCHGVSIGMENQCQIKCMWSAGRLLIEDLGYVLCSRYHRL